MELNNLENSFWAHLMISHGTLVCLVENMDLDNPAEPRDHPTARGVDGRGYINKS